MYHNAGHIDKRKMKQKLIFIGNSIVAGYPWNKSKSFASVLRRALKGEYNENCTIEDVGKSVGGSTLADSNGSFGIVRTGNDDFKVDCIDLTQPAFAKNTGFDIVNKGINGDTTAGILHRFKTDVMDHQPNMVFILTGTNDFIYRDATPDEAFANLELMAEMVKDAGGVLVYITPLPVDAGKAECMWMAGFGISYDAVNRDLENFSEMIRQSGRLFVDLNQNYLRFIDAVGDVDLAFMDGLHPMPAGQEFIASEVLGFLNEYYTRG